MEARGVSAPPGAESDKKCKSGDGKLDTDSGFFFHMLVTRSTLHPRFITELKIY